MNLRYSMKDYFFDKAEVLSKLTDGEAKALSKVGAYIRQAAKFDFLRRRNRPAVAGESPSVHSRDAVANLRNIQFAYEPGSHSVVVGSVKVQNVRRAAFRSASTVPQLMEFGGAALVDQVRFPGMQNFRIVKLDQAKSMDAEYKQTAIAYQPHPYMEPAMQREIKKQSIRDAFRGMLVA